MRPILAATLAIALMLAPSVVVSAQSTFVVRDVRLFDGERVTEHRSVVVRDGVIAQVGGAEVAVPAGAQVVDGRGRTLLPGLIDAHVHLTDETEADLRQSLALGVTTVLDMWTGGPRFERIKTLRAADAPDVADVRTAGTGATAPGGHPTQMGGGTFPTIADSADAQAFVDARLAEGSDYVKIVYDDLSSLGRKQPMLSRRMLERLVAAAHARGKLAVVHILSEWQAREAIEAGADGLVHLFTGATVSPEFVGLAARRGVFVVPTLTVVYGGCGQAIGARIASRLVDPAVHPAGGARAGGDDVSGARRRVVRGDEIGGARARAGGSAGARGDGRAVAGADVRGGGARRAGAARGGGAHAGAGFDCGDVGGGEGVPALGSRADRGWVTGGSGAGGGGSDFGRTRDAEDRGGVEAGGGGGSRAVRGAVDRRLVDASALVDLAEQWLHVEDRGAVEGFEVADLDARAVDGGDLDAVQADGVRAVGGSRAEDSFLRSGLVAAWVDAEDVAVGAIEPGEEQDLVARS